MQRVKSLLLAFRPKTLTAAAVPILTGTALVHAIELPIHWWISLLALAASFFIQIGTNLVNDAADFKKGADTETRIGPRRITQAGVFSHRQVMSFAGIFFLAAVLCGVPLVMSGGWPIVLIGIASVFCGFAYTAGPFPLAYLGLGDLFVILFFGLTAVLGLVYLQTHLWRIEALVLGLQIGLHCTVLIAVNNLRDIDGDRLVDKRTLPVRYGKSFARREIAALCFIPFVLQVYWLEIGFFWAGLLPILTLPLAIKIVRLVHATEPSPVYNRFLAMAAGLHLVFGILLAIGLIL